MNKPGSRHNICGIDSIYGGSMYKEPGDHPGMDVYDARDGTNTWMDRQIAIVTGAGTLTVEQEVDG